MRWVTIKMTVKVFWGSLISMALLGIILESWNRLIYMAGQIESGYGYDYQMPAELGVGIGYFLITAGCAMLGYVTLTLTFYWLVILDELLQYVDIELVFRSPGLYKKAYVWVSMLPVL